MGKRIFDAMTVFVFDYDCQEKDEYDLYNDYVERNNCRFSFEDAQALILFIRRLRNVDKRILCKTRKIITER